MAYIGGYLSFFNYSFGKVDNIQLQNRHFYMKLIKPLIQKNEKQNKTNGLHRNVQMH